MAKDRNGASDPFVVVSVLSMRHQTPVAKRTLNPVYNPKDATFEFPLYLSLADKLVGVELVVWDKDMLSKEYLGEVALSLESWFRGEGEENVLGFDEPGNKPFSVDLLSTRPNTPATGSIQLKIGFVPPHGTHNLLEYDEIYGEFVKRSRPSLVSAPATEGVGTIRSHHANGNQYAFQDDGGLSSDDEDDEEEGEDEFVDAHEDHAAIINLPLTELYTPPTPTELPPLVTATGIIRPPPPELVIQPSSPGGSTTPTRSAALKTATPLAQPTPKATSGGGFMPKMKFTRKISGLTGIGGGGGEGPRSRSRSSSPVPRPPASPVLSSPGVDGGDVVGKKKKRFSRKSSEAYKFGSEANDVVGIVMLEIQGAVDLPRFKNMTRTGWDMDPFVVVSFGKKVFRTRVIRHSRNPVWDEKLLFHVRRYETSFKVNLAILDWDKLSSNDYVGDVSFDVGGLVESAPQPDHVTGLYAVDEGGDHPMVDYKLPLVGSSSWEGKYSPVLSFRAKYQPYDALRQRFWRQYLKQYDTDDTGALSHLELTSMLDSLGSTLTRSTVSSFFTRNGKKAESDELSFEEAIKCLEDELGRPVEEKRRVDIDAGESCVPTPVLMVASVADGQGRELKLEEMDFSKDQIGVGESGDDTSDDPLSSSGGSGSVGTLLPPEEKKKKKSRFRKSSASSSSDQANKKKSKGKPKKSNGGSKDDNSELESDQDSVERVINVKSCPLCHRPRMNSKAEMDIITHLAVCASRDWSSVDKIVVGNFVTASQAQRKWYTRVIGKISNGDYKLGANSANIIVQNRITGQLEEEKMQVYVRLGIRLLYKGASSRMEGARARRLLKSLSIKQGVKYDAPESAREIPVFIEFHKLNVGEIEDPLDSFKTFNQFFYRKLKSSARPVESLDNPYRLVSGADCRMMAFETVSEATRLWIKGREFTVARLLGENYKQEAERYTGGALAIFRLAPQDYHRFHTPVEGTIGNMTDIAGEYYTVNPQAIRTALDVYGENVRKIVPIDSPQFGRVMAVCVGAMMVGSIKTTVEEGQYVQRGDEFGYFAFGGSTIVVLFEKGKVEWDEDLLINGRASLETLVRVGMGIGKGRPAVAGAV